MGTVAITFRIMPSSADVDIEQIKEEIKNISINGEIKSVEEKPIAFGLKALDVLIIMSDTGGIDKIEKMLSSIDGVASVESGDVTLL
ncbi:MAG: elongation factor 1-beta [Candidatus Aenigmatarchaeota archaeon]